MDPTGDDNLGKESFQHTVAELQDLASKTIIEDSKVILVSTGFWKLSCRWIQSGVVTRTLCQISTHFKVIRSRGSRKLSRTREQSSPPGPSPSLGWHQYLKRRLRNRWEAVLQKARYEQPDTGRSPHFREAHVRTLMEQNCRRHLGTEEDTPLAADAFSEACTQLKESIDGQAAMASFVCGGSIAVGNSAVVDVMTSPPVSIFWATRHDSAARKLVLPLNNSAPESSHDVLRQLVADCEPATFGRGDQDVLDPEYRKAGKIDPHQFVTSFHPARFGIIENIEQILLPSVSTEIEDRLQFRRITPELYKLNAYSGPSGIFREHVDTPRSDSQIGSLVVCLPSLFQGGAFCVRHDGQQVEFNWDTQSAAAIQWAAFYSDCEHETMRVIEGDRITSTYNLYVAEPVGRVIPRDGAIVEPQTLPLYASIRHLTADPGFMKDGGVLGFYCSHAYPHTSKVAHVQLPQALKGQALKGSDLVLYSAFAALGFEVDILPVIEKYGRYGPDSPKRRTKDSVKYSDASYMESYAAESYYIAEYLKGMDDDPFIEYEEVLPQRPEWCADLDSRWKLLLLPSQVKGMKKVTQLGRKKGLPTKPNSAHDLATARAGTGLLPIRPPNLAKRWI